MNLKLLSLALIGVLVLNLVLFVLGKLNEILFWVVIIATAIVAYKVLPKLKKK